LNPNLVTGKFLKTQSIDKNSYKKYKGHLDVYEKIDKLILKAISQ